MSPGFAQLLGVVCVACVQTLAACTTEVEIFKTGDSPMLAAAAASGVSNSTNVLISPGAATPNPDLNCAPGHYVGTFNGTYNSAAWGNGSVPLQIAAAPSMDRPGLEFWLEQIPRNCRVDEEFCADFTLKGGKIHGFANPFSDANPPAGDTTEDSLVVVPFEIDFGGDLDCLHGQFRGLLQNGCYDFVGTLYRFVGTAPATYDAASFSFNDGGWNVKELADTGGWLSPDSNIGGMGSWQASLANDASNRAADGDGLCDK